MSAAKNGGKVPVNLTGIIVLTGVPGAGKTLRMMEYMEAAIKAGRPCYECNVDGINMPGVMHLDNPHNWQDLPPTSVLFVDEAQKFFRARRGMVDPPDSITAMETIRHDGVCIVMTTQQPTYLDKHIRGLAGRHEHLVEVIPGKLSNVYAFRSVREEISPSSLGDAEYQAWSHPTRLHTAYKSAEVHTKTIRFSLRTKLLAAGVLFSVGLLAWAFSGGVAPETEAAQEAQASGPAHPGGIPTANGTTPMTDGEYFDRMQPRMEGAPWSARIYDEVNEVAPPPRIACMIGAEKCRCITDQGTRYHIEQKRCRQLVENGGILNPFRDVRREEQEAQGLADERTRGDGGTPSVEGAPAPAPAPTVGVGNASVQQASYGAMRPGAAASPVTASPKP